MGNVSNHRLPPFVAAGLLVGALSAQSALIHYYRFDEGAGLFTADEIVANSQDGTLLSGMDAVDSWIPSGVPGEFGGANAGSALVFTGVRGDGNFDVPDPPFTEDQSPNGVPNNAVNFGNDSSFNLANEGTIMFWYRQDPGPSGSDLSDIAVNNPYNANWIVLKSGGGMPYIIQHQPSQGLNMRFEGKLPPFPFTAATVVQSPGPLPTGKWVHYAVSWSTTAGPTGYGDVIIYSNGVAVADTIIGIFTGLGEAPSNFVLGGEPSNTGTGRGCACAVDELKVFDNFLDAAGVQAQMAVRPSAPARTVSFSEIVQKPPSFSFETRVGRTYSVEVATDLAGGDWAASGPSYAGDGSVLTHYDTDGLPGRSYRFKVW